MYNVAVVGATGAVGREILKTLEKRAFPVKELYPLASARSAGKTVEYNGKEVLIQDVDQFAVENIDFAFFSAGSEISEKYARVFADSGAIVVDNTSLFRMDDNVPLIVPEVNGYQVLGMKKGIIANPNCSTIQMVQALKGIDDLYGINRVVVSTYQSVSGSGQKGMEQLTKEVKGEKTESDVYAREIAYNVIPQIDTFTENGFTKEEMKMINETKKIMNKKSIKVNATCVRVPVMRGHSESIYVETNQPINVDRLVNLWEKTRGLEVKSHQSDYPTPKQTEKTDETYIGRIRKDLENPNAMSFWVVSDNLLKGAALNSVQIAEQIIKNN